jgi:tetratricopeptide (TPR) repeat protein
MSKQIDEFDKILSKLYELSQNEAASDKSTSSVIIEALKERLDGGYKEFIAKNHNDNNIHAKIYVCYAEYYKLYGIIEKKSGHYKTAIAHYETAIKYYYPLNVNDNIDRIVSCRVKIIEAYENLNEYLNVISDIAQIQYKILEQYDLIIDLVKPDKVLNINYINKKDLAIDSFGSIIEKRKKTQYNLYNISSNLFINNFRTSSYKNHDKTLNSIYKRKEVNAILSLIILFLLILSVLHFFIAVHGEFYGISKDLYKIPILDSGAMINNSIMSNIILKMLLLFISPSLFLMLILITVLRHEIHLGKLINITADKIALGDRLKGLLSASVEIYAAREEHAPTEGEKKFDILFEKVVDRILKEGLANEHKIEGHNTENDKDDQDIFTFKNAMSGLFAMKLFGGMK